MHSRDLPDERDVADARDGQQVGLGDVLARRDVDHNRAGLHPLAAGSLYDLTAVDLPAAHALLDVPVEFTGTEY